MANVSKAKNAAKLKAAVAQKAAEKAGVGVQAAPPTALPAIYKIKTSAMSKDVGVVIARELTKAKDAMDSATTVITEARAKSKIVLAQLTMACIKAANNDANIDLNRAFSGDKKDKNILNDQMCLALGLREIVSRGDGAKTKQVITWAEAVKDIFPMAGENKDTELFRKKNTWRSNFIHQLGVCTQTAAGIIESKIKAEVSKAHGTLLLTGPAVQRQFGAPSVLLNEKQTVYVDKKGRQVNEPADDTETKKLNVKPSFHAIADKAAKARGGGSAPRVDSRKKISGDPDIHIANICSAFIASIQKIKGSVTDAQRASLEGVGTVLDEVLDS